MPDITAYRIRVAADSANPGYYRWTILQDGLPIDLPGYAYASAWSAEQAARTAVRWHRLLKPVRSQPDVREGSVPDSSKAPAARAIRSNLTRLKKLVSSRLMAAHLRRT